MHVYLTGATGFVGAYVLRALITQGHTARCLVRHNNIPLAITGPKVEKVKGDITNPKVLTGTLRGCDAVLHLVGIIEEHPAQGITFEQIHHQGTVHLVDEAKQSGIERFIQMSANGARSDGVSAYQTSKWAAEEYVKQANFQHWTIFRPAVIFGDPGPDSPEFCTQLAQTLIKPFPVLPIFGDGSYRLQPISVETVAAALVQALTTEAASGQTYTAVGQEAYAYTEILDIITQGLGLALKPKLPQPIWLIRPLIQAAAKFGLLPISPDQFEMLIEGNTGDPTAFYDDFDVPYKPFTPDHLGYLRSRQ